MFEFLADWIRSNTQLLSGLAALIALVGVIASPLGRGTRILFRHYFLPAPDSPEEKERPVEKRARPTVAVMPFKNNSGDPAQDYLADGFSEDVITTLSYTSGFDVIARNSTFAYKGHATDIREIGTNLGADYIVEGSLRTLGEVVRVTVQVSDSENGSHIWAEKFDRPLRSFLDLQDEVVETIACQVGPEIERSEVSRTNHLTTQDLGAWALVRRASVIFNSERNTRANLDRVIEFSMKAIEIDDQYTEAYGLLSRAYSVAVIFDETEDQEQDIGHAEQAYARMRELAPNHADTFFTQGQLALATNQIQAALAAFKGAYERNPNNVLVLSMLGLTAARLGYAHDGIELIERALRLSPRDPTRHLHHFALANASLSIGDYDKALAHAKHSVDLANDFPAGLATYAGALQQVGREDEARAQIVRIKEVSPGTTRSELLSGAQAIGGLSADDILSFEALLQQVGFD